MAGRDDIAIALAGRFFVIRPIPFGRLRTLQPAYLAFVDRLAGGDLTRDAALLGDMGELVRDLIDAGGTPMPAEEFDALTFVMSDLVAAFRAIGPALGLRVDAAGEDAPAQET
ncbi:MAG: hypothetical protein QM651_16030 [Rhodoblastus sp.]